MRSFSFLCILPAGLIPVAAAAQEVEASVTLASRYLDTDSFNEAYGNTPAAEIEVELSLNENLYAEAYAEIDSKGGLKGRSSEYGFAVGGNFEITPEVKLNLEAGRYADYRGRGFKEGDWYAKAGVTYKRATVSVSYLEGATDSALIRADYSLPIGNKLTIKPSVAYIVAEKTINPAVEMTYRLDDHWSLGATVLSSKDDDTGKRHVYAGASLTFKF